MKKNFMLSKLFVTTLITIEGLISNEPTNNNHFISNLFNARGKQNSFFSSEFCTDLSSFMEENGVKCSLENVCINISLFTFKYPKCKELICKDVLIKDPRYNSFFLLTGIYKIIESAGSSKEQIELFERSMFERGSDEKGDYLELIEGPIFPNVHFKIGSQLSYKKLNPRFIGNGHFLNLIVLEPSVEAHFSLKDSEFAAKIFGNNGTIVLEPHPEVNIDAISFSEDGIIYNSLRFKSTPSSAMKINFNKLRSLRCDLTLEDFKEIIIHQDLFIFGGRLIIKTSKRNCYVYGFDNNIEIFDDGKLICIADKKKILFNDIKILSQSRNPITTIGKNVFFDNVFINNRPAKSEVFSSFKLDLNKEPSTEKTSYSYSNLSTYCQSYFRDKVLNLNDNLDLSSKKPLRLENSYNTLNGQGFCLKCLENSSEKSFSFTKNSNTYLKNITLKDFDPEIFSFEENSNLYFQEKCSIESNKNIDLFKTPRVFIKGQLSIKSNQNKIVFNPDSLLTISQITFEDADVYFENNKENFVLENTAVILKNSRLHLNKDLLLKSGAVLFVEEDCKIINTYSEDIIKESLAENIATSSCIDKKIKILVDKSSSVTINDFATLNIEQNLDMKFLCCSSLILLDKKSCLNLKNSSLTLNNLIELKNHGKIRIDGLVKLFTDKSESTIEKILPLEIAKNSEVETFFIDSKLLKEEFD